MKRIVFFTMLAVCSNTVFAQTHNSVNLDSQVYHILEQAEIRGLCMPLSGVRPYTQNVIVNAINEILNSDKAGKLRRLEQEILEQYLEKYAKPQRGFDWQKGAFHGETAPEKKIPLSVNAGVNIDMEGSAGIYPSFEERYLGAEGWVQLFLNGDIGRNVSYEINAAGGLLKIPRFKLGKGNTYYDGFIDDPNKEFVNRETAVYSEPMTQFPYSYRKKWDGSVFFMSHLSGSEGWPDSVSGGVNFQPEMTAAFFENKLIVRTARISHEWGANPLGSSLALNEMARPFLGVEAEFNPVAWFGISTITGILEYNNSEGIKTSAEINQNAFSMSMLEFKLKNYLYFDIIESAVWPKRFELGYMIPLVSSFFYQNNIGDFDNLALAFNLKGQYPGIGNIWLSLFVDEINVMGNWRELDRAMMAGQAGINIALPFLAFSSIVMSYTKVNPYCYTHNRNFTPWYSDVAMETSYTNNGRSLGHYLPPNSDEIMFRFKTMPAKGLGTHLQYQMIRHGASYGSSEVDGSSLVSELGPVRHGPDLVLKRFFLKDGAYQWQHIIKIGAEWKIPKIPVSLFGEAGAVISYFTNIKEPANITGKAHPYSKIDTAEYPKSTGFVVRFGVNVFPR